MELTATEYLDSQDMDLKLTCLFTVQDGCLRQPDLIFHMEQFAALKMERFSKSFEGGESKLRQYLHDNKH